MTILLIGLDGFFLQNGGTILIFHSATNTTPYEVVYGQPPPIHLPYLLGDSKVDNVDRSL